MEKGGGLAIGYWLLSRAAFASLLLKDFWACTAMALWKRESVLARAER